MSRQVAGFPSSIWSTFAFLAIFVVAFFPHTFIGILDLPFGLTTDKPVIQQPVIQQPVPCTALTHNAMTWFQKTISLPARARGSYLVTDTIVKELPEIKQYRVGVLHLFIQHTSAALSMNENWDEEVREDMSDALDRIVPEDRKGNLYRHAAEGSDDMPAHVKSALIGSSVSIPISNGKLATGTWQGIWYLEFRTAKHSRKVVATINGEKAS